MPSTCRPLLKACFEAGSMHRQQMASPVAGLRTAAQLLHGHRTSRHVVMLTRNLRKLVTRMNAPFFRYAMPSFTQHF